MGNQKRLEMLPLNQLIYNAVRLYNTRSQPQEIDNRSSKFQDEVKTVLGPRYVAAKSIRKANHSRSLQNYTPPHHPSRMMYSQALSILFFPPLYFRFFFGIAVHPLLHLF